MVGAFLVAAIAFVVIAAGGINKNLVYYWTPADLRAAGDKAYGATIRLGGMVTPGSVRNRSGVSGLEFDVHDGRAMVHVKSNGVPPQMFRENIGVVVEGTMTRGGYFQCNRLMVSHSNEYRAPKGGHPVDRKELEKLMRSTEGLESK
jgi:cytochrome c-type biogenesis protein CcmE